MFSRVLSLACLLLKQALNMPRRERIFGEGITYHVTSQCNNGDFLFQQTRDFVLFLNYLKKAKDKFGFDLHAYQVMQNHVHLIIKTNETAYLNVIMHWLCHSFAELYNKIYERKGHFWRDRYKAKIINNDLYGLACLRYIHRNVLEAGMVEQIENWPWNCYSHYAFGAENNLITPMPTYLGLANENKSRQEIYRKWVKTPLISKKTEGHLFESKAKSNSIRQKRIISKELKPVLAKLAT